MAVFKSELNQLKGNIGVESKVDLGNKLYQILQDSYFHTKKRNVTKIRHYIFRINVR